MERRSDGQAVDVSTADGTTQIRVRHAYTLHFFSATVNAVDGKIILDGNFELTGPMAARRRLAQLARERSCGRIAWAVRSTRRR